MKILIKYSFIILFIFPQGIFAQKNSFIQAKIDFQQKKYEEASNEIQKYFSKNKFNKDALFLSAKINLEQKHYKKAIQNLNGLSPKKYPELNLLLARAYAGINDEQNAISYLSKYLKQKNKLSEDKIIAFPEFGNIADREAWQTLWEKKLYTKKELMFLNAQSAFVSGDYEQAEIELNNYILKYDIQPEVLYMKAEIASSQDNWKDALNYLDKAVSLSNNVKYLKARAEAEYKMKKYNKALSSYGIALQKDSLDLEIYYQRALVYAATGKYENAINDIQKYLLYFPEDEKALDRFAMINYQGKDYLSAIRTYSKLIEKHPEKAEYFKKRADAYMQTHTYTYAIKDYSMALDLYPRDPEIYYQKGMAHFHLNQMDKACAAWKKAQRYGSNKCDKLLYKYCK